MKTPRAMFSAYDSEAGSVLLDLGMVPYVSVVVQHNGVLMVALYWAHHDDGTHLISAVCRCDTWTEFFTFVRHNPEVDQAQAIRINHAITLDMLGEMIAQTPSVTIRRKPPTVTH